MNKFFVFASKIGKDNFMSKKTSRPATQMVVIVSMDKIKLQLQCLGILFTEITT